MARIEYRNEAERRELAVMGYFPHEMVKVEEQKDNEDSEMTAEVKIADFGTLEVSSEASATESAIKGYTHISGKSELLTVGNHTYEIHVDGVVFTNHFLNTNVVVEPLKSRVKLTVEDGTQIEALILNCVDSVSPEDANLTEAEAERLFQIMMESKRHTHCVHCGAMLTPDVKSARSTHQCVSCHVENPFGIYH